MIYIKPLTYIVMALLPLKKKVVVTENICLFNPGGSQCFLSEAQLHHNDEFPNKAKRVPVVAVLDVADQMQMPSVGNCWHW